MDLLRLRTLYRQRNSLAGEIAWHHAVLEGGDRLLWYEITRLEEALAAAQERHATLDALQRWQDAAQGRLAALEAENTVLKAARGPVVFADLDIPESLPLPVPRRKFFGLV